LKEPDLYEVAEYYYGQSASLFCCPSSISQALRAAIVAAELPLCGKLRAEATTVFIDQRILEEGAVKLRANVLCTDGDGWDCAPVTYAPAFCVPIVMVGDCAAGALVVSVSGNT